MVTAHAKTQDTSLSVAEIERQYPDERVRLEITGDHKRHERRAGRLIAHSPHRADLDEPYRRLRAEQPQVLTYVFYTGELVRDDAVVIL